MVSAHILLSICIFWNELAFFQGELVDRIEENIKLSHNYVEKAVADTSAAVEISKSVRKVSRRMSIYLSTWQH